MKAIKQSAQFGRSVGSAGDINSDGFDDVLIGSDAYTNGQSLEGRTFVYHGSAAGNRICPSGNSGKQSCKRCFWPFCCRIT
ncbi:MAG: FG-GAP repeat protein [Bacteroidetes bacterium]|nr:FG-GAP repeat protein [Bacteroidota bacterium]